MLIPAAFAIAEPLQWLAAGGGPANVRATTRLATSGLSGGMRDRRVLSRQSPAAPSSRKRSCQRQITRLGLTGGLHDLSRAATISRQKDDLCPPDVLLRAIAVGDHRLKLAAVGSAQLEFRSLVHTLDSHTRVLQGIPKRIEVSDLDH